MLELRRQPRASHEPTRHRQPEGDRGGQPDHCHDPESPAREPEQLVGGIGCDHDARVVTAVGGVTEPGLVACAVAPVATPPDVRVVTVVVCPGAAPTCTTRLAVRAACWLTAWM